MVRYCGNTTGVNRQTITNVLDGRGWATIAVLADLERALGARLCRMNRTVRHDRAQQWPPTCISTTRRGSPNGQE
jgi:hypothetical protein